LKEKRRVKRHSSATYLSFDCLHKTSVIIRCSTVVVGNKTEMIKENLLEYDKFANGPALRALHAVPEKCKTIAV